MFAEFLDPEPPPPPGLTYGENLIDERTEAELIAWIDAQPWDVELSRRRQWYGGSYGSDDEAKEMPEIIGNLARRLLDEAWVTELPDRCLINEYTPGQGIAAHVDYDNCGNEIVMISLLDSYPMEFAHTTDGRKYEKWLSRRSICVIRDEARWEWTHEIHKRKADVIVGGGRKLRGRRVSVTLRKSVRRDDAANP